ncbi:MAG: transglutaminase-like domain-containing protein, partial [Limisphaerales bacterium]
FPDWSAFAGWYGRITRLTAEITPEIQSKATELTRGFTNQEDQVRALYNYVTGLRYVAVPLGVNSLRPHSAANVLRNQYGDCKDKANLLNALLAAVHVDANLVLVPRFGQADPAVPGCAFNHAISRVRLGARTLWVDTTDDICRFGLLPPGDPGRNVLVADGESSSLARLPQPEPSDHQVKFEAEVDASPSGEDGGWPVQFRVTAHGFPDYQFREVAREAGQGVAAVPLIAIRWRPVSGSFAGDRQTMTPVSQLDQDFTWRGEGTLIGLSAPVGDEHVLRSPFWLPKEWDLALHRRHNPLFLNQGYPLIVDEEFKFRGVPGAAATPLPSPCENVKLPLRWRVAWARVADDQIQARFHAEVAPGELSQAETVAFQGQLRRLLSALATEATYGPAPGTR